MIALSVRNVVHRFGARLVLDDVSLCLPAGTFGVLLGENGAGKSTLLSLIAGLYALRAGEIRIFGMSVRSAPASARGLLGVVFQDPSLDLDLTVAENLAYHAALHGMPLHDARLRGDAELQRLGVLSRRTDRVRRLSGGLRRRVEIARALMHRPKLLVLDEPTSGLDPHTRAGLITAVRALCRERGAAVLWTTHQTDEAEHADTVLVLSEGKLARDERPR